MKTITINKNKNYFRTILALMLIICALYFCFKFLLNPSEFVYFLLPSKEIVFVFSTLGIVSCFLGIYLILKIITRKNVFIIIDSKGIYDGFSIYNQKFIKWEEISNIKTIHHNYNNYIAIFTKKVLSKEKGLKYFFYKINEISMGTPYIISSGNLDCSFEELEKLIMESYHKNKKNR